MQLWLLRYSKDIEMGFLLSAFSLCLLLLRSSSGSTTCKDYQFFCDDGSCVDGKSWCDSVSNCPDGSDERYCKKIEKGYFASKDPNKCKDTHFKCSEGPCIPIAGRCDGVAQCEDSSDEQNCKNVSKNNAKEANNSTVSSNSVSSSDLVQPTLNSSHKKPETTDTDNPLQKAIDWLLSQRGDDFGWGQDTERALIALYLSRTRQTADHPEDMLMSKQLDIKLGIELSRNRTNPITLSGLSLYINALMVLCRDPRNFYGHDLVRTLRSRLDATYSTRNVVTPFVYLTLCLNNETSEYDGKRLGIYASMAMTLNKTDMKASTLLAIACIEDLKPNSTPLHNLRQNLLHELLNQRMPENIYELSLIAQALKEFPQNSEHRSVLAESIHLIEKHQKENGSFGDILATYYAVPVLSGRSILSLTEHCNHPKKSDLTPIEVLKNTNRKKIAIHYTLRYGDPQVDQTLDITVAEGTNFLDIMRLAREICPKYRFELDNSKASPEVYSIGGIPNDVEKGIYWMLYVQFNDPRAQSSTGYSYRHYTRSIKDLEPHSGDKIMFWLKKPAAR